MRRVTALAVSVLLSCAAGAGAEAPMTSLRPQPNPGYTALPPVTTVTTENTAEPGALRPRPRPAVTALPAVTMVTTENEATPGSLRPRPRPAGLAPEAPVRMAVMVAKAGAGTLRPMPRPDMLSAMPTASAAAMPAATADATPEQRRNGGLFGGLFGGNKKPPRSTAPVAGSVCGDPAIRGEDVARITSKVRGCGIEEPVRVTSIDGIRLNSPATIDCNTATALRTWIDQGLRPAFKGREIVELRIAASYICRPRNNVKGNRISEHGRGKAVDVAGVVFSDGSLITVSDNYAKLRRPHKAACGIFGTTLGPGSDGYHEDHLHFDTASYRSGPYCR
ncbi:MAG: extensin family protein [Rhodobacteraceae bacterium PARR1]|nr:MAG: extensin family protein [Rhodobacteraceae bacterium PARR1]